MSNVIPRSGRSWRQCGVLDSPPTQPPPWPRTAETVSRELRELQERGELDLPLPGRGDTLARWRSLARYGRRDLCLARLAEGHVDAAAILGEAGRRPVAGALYGVWASRSGGTGASVYHQNGKWRLCGMVRFCSGAGHIDRALVTARAPDNDQSWLIDVDLVRPEVEPRSDSWPALGMDASASLDVAFHDVTVSEGSVVGPPGFYTNRCGFALGGAGVAAVWLGGAAGALDVALAAWADGHGRDPHRLALLGALHTQLTSTEALLTLAAQSIDAAPGANHELLVAICRSAAEKTAREVIDVVPRMVGPGPLCWDPRLAQKLADLQVYIRQHHGEADLAALGLEFLDQRGGLS
jgi:alkylation response protein AidB-like acyl-CoA dehydrogenase